MGMLILSRNISEEIKIGDDITLTVLGVKGSQVRLGFEAPESIQVHRKEIYDRIKAEEKLRAEGRLPAAARK